MAEASTVYNVNIDLADMDRGVYEALDLRVARHPSETAAFMLVRLLAYCLEYTEGIEMTAGLSSADEPAIVVRDLTGRVTKWIEIGLPDADRLHRGSKFAGNAAVYTHRDVRQLLVQLHGRGVHRADEIPIRAFNRAAVDETADLLGRRSSFSLNVSDGELLLSIGERNVAIGMTEYRIGK